MTKFKAAAIQTFSTLADPRRNLTTVVRAIEEAAGRGAKLIVFPECMNSGYVWKDQVHAVQCADPIPGEFTTEIARLAARLKVYVAIGLSEKDGEKVFNSAALVGPDGLIGRYQKNFLFDFDPDFFTWGTTGYPVFDTEIGKIGMFICADARIPEGARALTLNGAEILLHITNSTTHEQHEMHVPTRGNESEAWIISADKFGKEEGLTYPGHTLIIAPDGTEVAHGSGEKEEIVYGDIDLDAVRRVRAGAGGILRGRRPDTYGILTSPYESLPISRIVNTPVVPARLAVLVAALQVTNTGGDDRATLDLAVRTGWEAARENARLIVFPELFLCRPDAGSEQLRQSAALTPRALDEFGRAAKQWGANYVLSLVEQDGGRLYHTAFVVGADGNVATRYRKVHLTESEARWATAGNDYCVLELPFGNAGIMLGHEVRFCEVARILTCLGADVILMPSAWRHPRESALFSRERALENKIFVVAANRLDAPCAGDSKVILPNGAIASRAGQGQTDYVFQYLNLAWARDKQIRPGTDLIRNRRPQFYAKFNEPAGPAA
ncbi:MAG: carbon-nitrogen hydrolase family protein [Burkholderiales bacterium]|nr:carbon-nitrogen hydrolase family protein [Burkholderiales bacterium]